MAEVFDPTITVEAAASPASKGAPEVPTQADDLIRKAEKSERAFQDASSGKPVFEALAKVLQF